VLAFGDDGTIEGPKRKTSNKTSCKNKRQMQLEEPVPIRFMPVPTVCEQTLRALAR